MGCKVGERSEAIKYAEECVAKGIVHYVSRESIFRAMIYVIAVSVNMGLAFRAEG